MMLTLSMAILVAASSMASPTMVALILSAMLSYTVGASTKLQHTLLTSNSGLIWDHVSLLLSILTVLVAIWALGTINGESMELSSMSFLVLVLSWILIMTFGLSSVLKFYFMFECSLLPITLIILGWGYQPERIPAAMAMLLYTILGSLPLLLIVLTLQSSFVTLEISFLSETYLKDNSLLVIMAMLGFLVKFPMFGVHLWLPKAHVEAPVAGSMILAAILLKLGGYGLWRISLILPVNQLSSMILSMALIGGGIIAMVCLRQLDLKVMIAYSSVSHMSLAIATILAHSPLAFKASLLILIAHGISSSAMFFTANLLYTMNHSRNFLMMSGALSMLPSFTVLWFIACSLNMAAPPSLNLLGEILSANCFMGLSFILLLPFSVSAFFAVAYSLILYANSCQGQKKVMGLISPIFSLKNQAILISHAWLGVLVIVLIL